MNYRDIVANPQPLKDRLLRAHNDPEIEDPAARKVIDQLIAGTRINVERSIPAADPERAHKIQEVLNYIIPQYIQTTTARDLYTGFTGEIV